MEICGDIEALVDSYNAIVGRHTLMIVREKKEGLNNVYPLILYDTEFHGKYSMDCHNEDLRVGDRVALSLQERFTEKENTSISSYCPEGFRPIFSIRKI